MLLLTRLIGKALGESFEPAYSSLFSGSRFSENTPSVQVDPVLAIPALLEAFDSLLGLVVHLV